MELHDLLVQRRTIREFTEDPVADSDVRRLLEAAQGSTADGRRTTPSAGGRYPLRLLVVRGTPLGTESWDPRTGRLQTHADGDVLAALAQAAIGDQPWVARAPVTIAICADTADMRAHFADQSPDGGRGLRYVDIEAGAAAQNLALQATALGLGGVLVGGFDDDAVVAALDLHHLSPVLLYSCGHPAADQPTVA